jgi:ParB family chromosome partitioning protein
MSETMAYAESRAIVEIPVDEILLNPYQPRRVFDPEALEDLAASVAEYGVLQPISVRVVGGESFELVAGERRLRAAKMAGLPTIPAAVVDISDQDSAIIALIENLQRQDLNFIEEAEGFMNLIADYGFTQEQLARRVGKKQSTIANKIRLLRLAPYMQKALLENSLTERHARAILRLPDEKSRDEALNKVIAGELNVRQTDELVDKLLAESPEAKRARPRVKPIIKDIRLFTNTVKQALDVMNRSGLKTTYDMEETGDGCFISIAVVY